MATLQQSFRFDRRFALVSRPLGITADNSEVVIHDDELVATFGPWTVRTPLTNIESAEVTGPYRWFKVIGPPHLSFADRGLTFATNADEGVCLQFAEPVPGIDPAGFIRHPSLTLTVEDPAALAALLDRRHHQHGRDEGGIALEALANEVHDDLISLTTAELRRRAADLGLAGTSRMSKSDLISALSSPLSVQ